MGKTKIRLEQFGIFTCGVGAIILVGLDPSNPLQRWGFVLGLISQPCWIHFSFRTKSWGVFLLSLIYTGSWINGIKNNFPF